MFSEDKVEDVKLVDETLDNLKTRWKSLKQTSHIRQERLTHALTLAQAFKVNTFFSNNRHIMSEMNKPFLHILKWAIK